MAPPFRADHIGSLLRPDTVLTARSTLNNVYYTTAPLPEATRLITDSAIATIADKQLSLGIRPITSGEYDRTLFYAGFFEYLSGMKIHSDISITSGCRKGNPLTLLFTKVGIPNYLAEWERLKTHIPVELWGECKITLPPITWEHIHLAPGLAYTSSSGYTSDKEYFTDLATAMAHEWQVLFEAGVRNIQVDDPALTYFLTDEMRAGCERDGVDPDELLDLYIWAQNLVLSQKPEGLHVGVHLCRGNLPNSTSLLGGSYERIAKKLFRELDYDTFYLEYDDERAGEFTPLREVPVGKNVVLGIVSTKRAEMEDVEEMVRKVYEAAEVLAQGQGRAVEEVLECLGVSPQCGFSSSSGGKGEGMTMERMWEKLLLVKEIARRVW